MTITASKVYLLAVIKVYITLENSGNFCYNMGRGKMSAKNVEKGKSFVEFYNLYKSLRDEGFTKDEILIVIRKILDWNDD